MSREILIIVQGNVSFNFLVYPYIHIYMCLCVCLCVIDETKLFQLMDFVTFNFHLTK